MTRMSHLQEEMCKRLEHLPRGENVAQEGCMVGVGLQQGRRIVRVVLQHYAIVRLIEHLLVVHEPAVQILALPEFDFKRLSHVGVVAEGSQALLVRLPAEVQLRGKNSMEEGEVNEEAALRHQRHQKACSSTNSCRLTIAAGFSRFFLMFHPRRLSECIQDCRWVAE